MTRRGVTKGCHKGGSHCDLSPRLGGAGVPLQGVGTQLATGPRLLSGCPQPPIMSPQDLPVPPGSSQRVHTPRHGPRTFCFDPDRNTPDCPISTLRSPEAFARLCPVLSHTHRVSNLLQQCPGFSWDTVNFLELGGVQSECQAQTGHWSVPYPVTLCSGYKAGVFSLAFSFAVAGPPFCQDHWPGAGWVSVSGW